MDDIKIYNIDNRSRYTPAIVVVYQTYKCSWALGTLRILTQTIVGKGGRTQRIVIRVQTCVGVRGWL